MILAAYPCGILIPENIVFDNACDLMKFCLSRTHTSKRAQIFESKNFIVDRLHIRGLVDPLCQEYCHPDKIPTMKGGHSMVCEQTNYDTGKWKHGAKHISFEGCNLFFYSIQL